MIQTDVTGRLALETLKTALLAEGVRISQDAIELLTRGGKDRLSIHEYPTTGGVTLILDQDLYVNTPFDEWYCKNASNELCVDEGRLVLRSPEGDHVVQRVLPLPGYLGFKDVDGDIVDEVAMSHADRIRLSPIVGCAYNCNFCDLGAMDYTVRMTKRLVNAIRVASDDRSLPPRHVLISGGSPRKVHYGSFLKTCAEIVAATTMPVDVMFSPMVGEIDAVEQLVDSGVQGFAINLEVFSEEPAKAALRGKYLTSRRYFEKTVLRAVELLGRSGRVRSLIIPGLEDPEDTLRGVEYLASLGCDPVLSPFRPADGTDLVDAPPPATAMLTEILRESRSITAKSGVALGPDCGPCQHNTLSFPWDLRSQSALASEEESGLR